ncbi:MAG: alkene reductase [Hyphomicrobiaceae bacterium]
MNSQNMFAPVNLGRLTLRNRIVMAPMTRSRADDNGIAADFAGAYYSQRADAGLLITESTQISDEGKGYPRTPGIHAGDQVEAWRRIVDAVHARGAQFVMQLNHVGRIASELNRSSAAETVGPSAVQAAGEMYTDVKGMVEHDVPRALTAADIAGIGQDFALAAKNAIKAGFDGVEFHAANGYLAHQFIATNANQRSDDYGGSVPNRLRAPLVWLDSVTDAVGSDRVGVRISPTHTFNDIEEADTEAVYGEFLTALSSRNLAYLHVIRPFANTTNLDVIAFARTNYSGNIVANGGFNQVEGAAFIADGKADAISFGSSFIANPDLVSRFKSGVELAVPNEETFYSPGREGYTDYPIAQT